MSFTPRLAFLSFIGFLTLILTGCTMTPSDAPTANPGLAILGKVQGGQQAIVGAHVYLLAANTTGNAGPGIAALTSNSSASLLTSVPSVTTLDTSGGPTNGDYYVTTAAFGAFSITGDYSCTPNTQVYLYALGGNTGSGANSAAGLLALLGNCPSIGDFLSATPFITINEVSTVAAAYAMAGYATDATHVSSSGSALAKAGIANAFANAVNLETLSTGAALSTTPTGSGVVPQAEINTLANILASCVNSNGPASSNCSTLLSNAKSAGGSGTVATDTASAAINIAHNPAANIGALYGLASAVTPFQPVLSSQPSDFTVALSFSGGGINGPISLAVDGAGNVWTVNGNHSISEINGVTGAAVSPAGGFTGNGLTAPFTIAIDPSGNAWVVDAAFFDGHTNSPAQISVFTPSGGTYGGSPFTGGGLNIPNNAGTLSPRDIAFDASGNAWIANSAGGGSVTELNGLTGAAISPATVGFPVTGTQVQPNGVAVDSAGSLWVSGFGGSTLYQMKVADGSAIANSGYQAGGLQEPYSIAIDSTNAIWLPNQNAQVGLTISKFTDVTTGSVYSGGGTSAPDGVAIDGGGNVWVSNEIQVNPSTTAGVTELSNSGVALSPSVGFASNTLYFGGDVGVDGSGNVWVANASTASSNPGTNVVEFVGAAVPVVTPVSVQVKTGKLGARP